MPQLIWKLLDTDNSNDCDIETWRAKIPGGWLVTTWAARAGANAKGAVAPGGSNWGGGVTFVPRTSNDWDTGFEKDEAKAK